MRTTGITVILHDFLDMTIPISRMEIMKKLSITCHLIIEYSVKKVFLRILEMPESHLIAQLVRPIMVFDDLH